MASVTLGWSRFRQGWGAPSAKVANYLDLGEAEIDATLFSGEYETNRILFFGLYSKWRW